MYSRCKTRLVFCMLYRINLCLKQLWHHTESFVLGKESRMLSNQIFFSPPLPFFFHLELNCQQGEKLYFSVWRVTFYAQFLHTAQRCWYSWCDLVVPCPWCWISFVQRIEKVSARHSARLCAVLCCAAFAVCYFLQWELFLCIWGWI